MFQINLKGHGPLYEQIKEQMKVMIVSGALKADEKIPSVRELAQMLTINPNTIQKAYKELEQEGFIYSIPAKGSFVSSPERAIQNVKQDDLISSLEKIVKELMYINVPSDQLISLINSIYGKGKGETDD